MLASHYAPPSRSAERTDRRGGEWLIGFGPVAGDASLSPSGDLREAAARLFDLLHRPMRNALGNRRHPAARDQRSPGPRRRSSPLAASGGCDQRRAAARRNNPCPDTPSAAAWSWIADRLTATLSGSFPRLLVPAGKRRGRLVHRPAAEVQDQPAFLGDRE
jgi:hypothetical protein